LKKKQAQLTQEKFYKISEQEGLEKQTEKEKNMATNASLVFLILTLMSYSAPCIFVNFLGLFLALLAFITGFLGLRKDYLKRRAIICLIVTLALTITLIIARSVIGWFLW